MKGCWLLRLYHFPIFFLSSQKQKGNGSGIRRPCYFTLALSTTIYRMLSTRPISLFLFFSPFIKIINYNWWEYKPINKLWIYIYIYIISCIDRFFLSYYSCISKPITFTHYLKGFKWWFNNNCSRYINSNYS